MRGYLTSLCALIATVLLVAGLAAAQGSPPPDPAGQQGALALFDWLYQAAQQHDRMAVVAGILVALTAMARWLAPKLHGKLGEVINGPIGKPLTVLVIAEIGAVTTALVAHKLDAHTLLSGLVVAFFAAGGYSTIKPLFDRLFGNPGTAAKAATAILLLAGLGLTGSGCACWQRTSADYNTAKCVVARDTVDCTVSAVETLVPIAIATLESFFGQAATIDWGKIEGALEAAGLRDGSCLLARIEQWIVTKLASWRRVGAPHGATVEGAEAHYREFQDLRARYLAKHGLGKVTYHFATGDVQ